MTLLPMSSKSLRELQKAAQQFSLGNSVAAEAICRALQLQFPHAVDVIHLLALICKKQGKVAEAEELFKNCIERAPQHAEFQANLGNLYRSIHRLEDARQQYREALSCDASFRPARLGLARLLNELGEHQSAEREALILVDNNDGDGEAWVVLAASRRGKRDYIQAEDAYRIALTLNPRYGIALQNLGALLTQLNRPDEALTQLDLAAKCGVTGSEINRNRASALIGLGQFEDAIEVLVTSVATMPADIEALDLLAKLRYMRGEEDFAREFATASINLPSNVGLQIRYARILQGADLLEAAENVLLDSVKNNGRHADVFCALAAVQQLAGKFEESLDHAQQAISDSSNNLQGIDLSIDALLSLGRVDEAKPLIEDARGRSPLNQWYVAMEAVVARLLGDPHYDFLYDYDKYVQQFELEPPAGWSSMDQFNADLITVLRQRHQFSAQPLDQSLRNGTQTPTSMLTDTDPVIKAFIACLHKPIHRYRETIGKDQSHPLESRNHGKSEIIGCWSVRLHRGGFHVNHVHPQGWLSSAYYVETPPEIEQSTDRAGWIKFGGHRFAIAGLTAEKFVKPEAGKLVLFPSYMWHGTNPIQGDAPRMSIAFDVITHSAGTAS